jgi:hypothetical protein
MLASSADLTVYGRSAYEYQDSELGFLVDARRRSSMITPAKYAYSASAR